jgi:phage/plasmid-like protein (TIGR03299 family)
MAHDINEVNGKASMFYFGDVPWHGLGQKLEKPATAAEALIAANLDYTVEKRALYVMGTDKKMQVVKSRSAIIRTDTHDVLGTVGRKYTPIQNRDAFAFFDPLVDKDEAIYHTAGALGSGERIWILAKLPGYVKVNGKDLVDKYLLLYNTHDGTSTIRVKLTPIRVVCNNTLSCALTGSEQEVHIRHTANAQVRLDEAHKVLGLANDLYKQLDEIFSGMVLKKITNAELLAYVTALIPDNPNADKSTRTEHIREGVLELVENGKGNAPYRGKLWGAYNGVVEYVDYARGKSKAAEKRLNSVWFGTGDRLKKAAFDLAVKMISKN